MANVKSTSNGGGMVSGIIAACIGVGVIIWRNQILKEEI
jgi:hypothetical protein